MCGVGNNVVITCYRLQSFTFYWEITTCRQQHAILSSSISELDMQNLNQVDFLHKRKGQRNLLIISGINCSWADWYDKEASQSLHRISVRIPKRNKKGGKWELTTLIVVFFIRKHNLCMILVLVIFNVNFYPTYLEKPQIS